MSASWHGEVAEDVSFWGAWIGRSLTDHDLSIICDASMIHPRIVYATAIILGGGVNIDGQKEEEGHNGTR